MALITCRDVAPDACLFWLLHVRLLEGGTKLAKMIFGVASVLEVECGGFFIDQSGGSDYLKIAVTRVNWGAISREVMPISFINISKEGPATSLSGSP